MNNFKVVKGQEKRYKEFKALKDCRKTLKKENCLMDLALAKYTHCNKDWYFGGFLTIRGVQVVSISPKKIVVWYTDPSNRIKVWKLDKETFKYKLIKPEEETL